MADHVDAAPHGAGVEAVALLDEHDEVLEEPGRPARRRRRRRGRSRCRARGSRPIGKAASMARSTSSRSPRSRGMRWLLGTEILTWVLDTTAPRLPVGRRHPAGVRRRALRSRRGRASARGPGPCAPGTGSLVGGESPEPRRPARRLAGRRPRRGLRRRPGPRALAAAGRGGRRHLRRGAARPRRAPRRRRACTRVGGRAPPRAHRRASAPTSSRCATDRRRGARRPGRDHVRAHRTARRRRPSASGW